MKDIDTTKVEELAAHITQLSEIKKRIKENKKQQIDSIQISSTTDGSFLALFDLKNLGVIDIEEEEQKLEKRILENIDSKIRELYTSIIFLPIEETE